MLASQSQKPTNSVFTTQKASRLIWEAFIGFSCFFSGAFFLPAARPPANVTWQLGRRPARLQPPPLFSESRRHPCLENRWCPPTRRRTESTLLEDLPAAASSLFSTLAVVRSGPRWSPSTLLPTTYSSSYVISKAEMHRLPFRKPKPKDATQTNRT